MKDLLRRLADRLRHPGETGTMRLYRRYREGIDHAYKVREPYDPSAPEVSTTRVGLTTTWWPVHKDDLADRERVVQTYLDVARMAGPMVGARIDPLTSVRLCPGCGAAIEWYATYCDGPVCTGQRTEAPAAETAELYDEWTRDDAMICPTCGSEGPLSSDTTCASCDDGLTQPLEDGDPDEQHPDPDRLYDAAVDDAIMEAYEAGRPDEWKAFMPGGER